MTTRLVPVSCLVIAGVLLAGCAGSPPAAPLTPASTEIVRAELPVAAHNNGSIAGNVTDDELRPIVGAVILLPKVNIRTTSDSAGAFTINGLEPGRYAITADAIGHQPVGRNVVVAAGLVARLDFVLAPLPTMQAYVLSIPRTFQIQFDQFQVSQKLHNQAGYNHSALCGNCISTLFFDPGPVQIRAEARWPEGNAAINSGSIAVEMRWKPSGYHAVVVQNKGHNDLGETSVERIGKDNVTTIELTVGSGPTSVSVGQKIETWTSFAYLERLAPGFTAFPRDEIVAEPTLPSPIVPVSV